MMTIKTKRVVVTAEIQIKCVVFIFGDCFAIGTFL